MLFKNRANQAAAKKRQPENMSYTTITYVKKKGFA